MADSRKTLAAVVGAVAGAAAVSAAVLLYLKNRTEEPIRDVQGAIGRAYDKIREIEKIASSRKTG